MKSYNITLTEAELLDVVTALEAVPRRVLRRGPTATGMYELPRRIVDQAAEQFDTVRYGEASSRNWKAGQLSLPYGPSRWWGWIT
jgi:hypothetical protein